MSKLLGGSGQQVRGRGMRSLAAIGLILASLGFSPARAGTGAGAGEAAAGQAAAPSGQTPAGPAGPQARDEAALRRRLEELEAQVAALRAEIDRLRAGGSGGVPGAQVAEIEKRVEALSKEIERLRIGAAAAPEATESIAGFGPAASKVYKVQRGVAIGGYGEMLYQNFTSTRDDDTPSGAKSEADFLRAVLYFGYKFDDRFLFNSEIEYEHAQAGEDAEGEVSVEFAYIDFRALPQFGARGGLVLVPVGFLNELHEPPTFHGAHRPQVEQIILPTTWRANGLGAYGEAGPVSYRAYVVTSLKSSGFSEERWIRGGRQSGSEEAATDLAFTARIDYTPVPGLLAGVSGFTGKTGQGVAGFPDGRLSLWDAHLEYNVAGWRFRGLYARGILSDAGDIGALIDSEPDPGVQPSAIGERAYGWYAEGAFNVLARTRHKSQDFSPFCRYEKYNTQDQVAAGFSADPANDVNVRTCGVTYKPIPNLAVKLDAMNFNNEDQSAIDQVNFALGYLF